MRRRGVSKREKGIRVNGPCCLSERKSSRTVCKGYTLLVILWVGIGSFCERDLLVGLCYCFSMKKTNTVDHLVWYIREYIFPLLRGRLIVNCQQLMSIGHGLNICTIHTNATNNSSLAKYIRLQTWAA